MAEQVYCIASDCTLKSGHWMWLDSNNKPVEMAISLDQKVGLSTGSLKFYISQLILLGRFYLVAADPP